jgi:cell division transport system permease protein
MRAWREQHLFGLVSSIGRLGVRPWATLLTVGVLAISIALPLCLGIVLGNLERISGSFRASRDISVFLKPHLDAEQARQFLRQVQRLDGVAEVQLRTPEQGLLEFREMSDFAGALAVLDYNPLPPVLVITPQEGSTEDRLAESMRSLPEVDFVQHDAMWRERLAAWLSLGRRTMSLLALLLGLGVLLIVGNTVRLDIQGRSEEIHTVQLLGATDGFIRRPFLYLGAWYGVLAGSVAILVAKAARGAIQQPVTALVQSYGSEFELQGLTLTGMLGVVGASIVLGWLGAWMATGHQLRQSLPQGDAR